MNIQDAWKIWAQPQTPPQDEPQQQKPTKYTRAEQLFDAVLWEAEYGDDDKKPFYFALAERLAGLLNRD